jgi:hypothetical protein
LPTKTSPPPTPVAGLQDVHGTATGAGVDEKPSAVAGSQDVHGTGTGTGNDEMPPFAGSQDASGREDEAGQKEDSDAPQESQVYVPQENVELKQSEQPAREENVETQSDQQPELPAPEENVEAALTPQALEKPVPEEIVDVLAAAPVPDVPDPDKENVEHNSDSGYESDQLPDHLKWLEIQPKF